MQIIEKVGRAGGKKQREEKQKEWDKKYGKNNWSIGYFYDNKFYTREEALIEFYDKSYYEFLKKNPKIVEEICKRAKTLYNPHARHTTGIDLQSPSVQKAIDRLGKKLEGNEELAVGVWGTNKGYKYPQISFKLDPYRVPLWCDKTINLESFWQEYKYLVINNK